MQEVQSAVVERVHKDSLARLFFLFCGCSNRHILGVCPQMEYVLYLLTRMCLLV